MGGLGEQGFISARLPRVLIVKIHRLPGEEAGFFWAFSIKRKEQSAPLFGPGK